MGFFSGGLIFDIFGGDGGGGGLLLEGVFALRIIIFGLLYLEGNLSLKIRDFSLRLKKMKFASENAAPEGKWVQGGGAVIKTCRKL